MKLSVITPVYQASAYLESFHERMSKAAQVITPDYEIIYVNDGSSDNSMDILQRLYKRDTHVVIIDLTRNFGQPNALRTGLTYATGDLVFTIDDDLEEQPEWLEPFYHAMMEAKTDVVFAAQCKRKGKWKERFFGALFFFVLQKVLRAKAIQNVMTARLMTKQHVRTLVRFKERNASFTALSMWTGCTYKVLYLNKSANNTSSYNLRKRWRLMINHVTSASLHPLHWPLLLAGLWGMAAAVFLASSLLPNNTFFTNAAYLEYGRMVLEITAMMLIMTSIGILGIYLSRMFDEMRARPMTIVRKVYSQQQHPIPLSQQHISHS